MPRCEECGGTCVDEEAIARRVVELLQEADMRRVPTPGNGRVALKADELAEAVMAALSAGPLSANQVQDQVRRRRVDVRDALDGLLEAGRAVKNGTLWSAVGRPPGAARQQPADLADLAEASLPDESAEERLSGVEASFALVERPVSAYDPWGEFA